MIISIAGCLVSALWVLAVLQRKTLTVGLPLAYILALLVIHVPGAVAYVVVEGASVQVSSKWTVIGIQITSIGCLSFATGVWLARNDRQQRIVTTFVNPQFTRYAVLVGWVFILAAPSLQFIPTVGAFAAKAAPIWILGATLGLKTAAEAKRWNHVIQWSAVALAFPMFTLLMTGFLSNAAVALIITVTPTLLLVRRLWPAALLVSVGAFLFVTLFLNYFLNRDLIRAAVWGGSDISERITRVKQIVTDFRLLDLQDPKQFAALDERLNQNQFLGLAAERIASGQAQLLQGSTLFDGVLSLIPRAIWPDKPITAGSGDIVRDATGLELSETTSWGVGNVMELYINFGYIGVVVGFFGLGLGLARLDRFLARQVNECRFATIIPMYLVGIALIFPEGSSVDMISGAGAAFVVGLALRELWKAIAGQKLRNTIG